MYSRSLVVLAVSAFPLLSRAAPFSIDVVTLPIPTELGFPGPSTTVTLSDAVSFINEKSGDVASMVGTPTLQGIQATLGLLQASNVIGPASATDLTAFITDVNSTPVVQVSSIDGPAITLATGTVGDVTTFAGQVFTIAPQNNDAAPSGGAADASQNSPTAQPTDGAPQASDTPPAGSNPTPEAQNANPNGAGSVVIPRSMWVGAGAVLGSMAAGALAVL
ncbi:hypothetical protein C8Q76DRAFT_840776 [Earliella scabrosa]|nr:hypothetical protein C8Q76DRAFT_840776 [Earliella scabrosa]